MSSTEFRFTVRAARPSLLEWTRTLLHRIRRSR